MTRHLHLATAVTSVLLAMPALGGTKPVEPPPSPPIVVGPTVIDTQTISTLLSSFNASSPEAQAALAALSNAPPGSIAAMTAVDALASALVISLETGSASLPAFNASQASQALGILDRLIAALNSAGVATTGLQALKNAIVSKIND